MRKPIRNYVFLAAIVGRPDARCYIENKGDGRKEHAISEVTSNLGITNKGSCHEEDHLAKIGIGICLWNKRFFGIVAGSAARSGGSDLRVLLL